jgi:hypothetical protein
MVVVSVFVTMDVGVSLGMMIISLWFLMFQLLVRPYKFGWVNTLQTVASACLLGLTILNSTAGVFLSVGFDPSGTPLEQLQQESEILMLLLLVVPPLSYGLLWWREIQKSRRAERSVIDQTAGSTGNPGLKDESVCSDELGRGVLKSVRDMHLAELERRLLELDRRLHKLGRMRDSLTQQRRMKINEQDQDVTHSSIGSKQDENQLQPGQGEVEYM